jgi:hypothetical protein
LRSAHSFLSAATVLCASLKKMPLIFLAWLNRFFYIDYRGLISDGAFHALIFIRILSKISNLFIKLRKCGSKYR